MSATLHASAVSLCPFSLSPGDHRAALVDIDVSLLIGEPHFSIVCPKAQRLNMQLPQTKEHYLSLLEDFFLSHCLLPQLFQLYKDVADPSFDTSSLSPRLEKLDLLHVEGMHYAETHCWKLYMGTLAYSPTLMLWFNQKILWSLVFKKLFGGHITSCHICHSVESSNPSLPTLRWLSTITKQHRKNTKTSSPRPPSYNWNSSTRNFCLLASRTKTSR